MSLSFRTLSLAAAATCTALSIVWLFEPAWLMAFWGLPWARTGELVGRRGGALFLGLAVMFASARNDGPSTSRRAMLGGFALACLTLAGLGLYEWANGRAGTGILAAAAAELGFALASMQHLVRDNTHSTTARSAP